MKTALTELIEDLKNIMNNERYEIGKQAVNDCIIAAISYLETEKQQIIDAYNSGWQYGCFLANSEELKPTKNSEEYYNETFNQTPKGTKI